MLGVFVGLSRPETHLEVVQGRALQELREMEEVMLRLGPLAPQQYQADAGGVATAKLRCRQVEDFGAATQN